MALSPEGTPPAQPPPPRNDVLPFAIGIVVGLGLGATMLAMIVIAINALLLSALKQNNPSYWVLLTMCAIPALVLGWLAIVQTRKALSFVSGLLIGLAVGLLGSTVICTGILAQLGNGTH